MTSARTLKRRHDARTTARALLWAPDRFDVAYHPDDWCDMDDDEDPPDDVCLHCRGDGMDPDCDYLLPCPDCGEVL